MVGWRPWPDGLEGPGSASWLRVAARTERSGRRTCTPTPCVARKPALRGLCFPAPCGARLLVMAFAAHVGEDSCPLHFAPELPESLLQILSFSDLNLQNLLTSFNLNCNCARRITRPDPLAAHHYKISWGRESTRASNQAPIPGKSFVSRFRSCSAKDPDWLTAFTCSTAWFAVRCAEFVCRLSSPDLARPRRLPRPSRVDFAAGCVAVSKRVTLRARGPFSNRSMVNSTRSSSSRVFRPSPSMSV